MRRLSELIECLSIRHIIGETEIPIEGVTCDSRKVRNGFVFVVIRGQNLNGSRFIPDAIKRGAVAVLAEEAVSGVGVAQVIVSDAREVMARLAAAFYGEPSRYMTLIGVTGTNGKTTTTYLVESILKSAGLNVGVIGTVNYRYMNKVSNALYTTPEAPELQGILREMMDSGITHCVMEVSSHALAQKRVDGCRFAGGVFTNLTQDHLDYHGTMDEYFKSKARLFKDFTGREKNAFSVINIDDMRGRELSAIRHRIILRYSVNDNAEVFPERASFSEKGIEAMLATPVGKINISSPLLGEYNLQNIMAAVGVGIGLGLDKKAIEDGVARLSTVRGRLERFVSKDGFQVVVDYAHTGDALERVLKTLRPLTRGRLITVFGCGGDRDKGKRPVMGEIAVRLSDLAIITSDNPRSEDPLEIIREIERGISETKKYEQSDVVNGKGYMIVADRHEAIVTAVNIAASSDTILIAGKGHEEYQIIGGKKILFDDASEVKKAIEERSPAGF